MMLASTNNKIALVHLTSRVKQTLIAMLSVTFGVSMYIGMNSFMTGVNDTQTKLAFSTLAHIHIYNDTPEDHSDLLSDREANNTIIHIRNPKSIKYTDGIKNSGKIMQVLKQYPGIETVTPEVNINVFFRNGATKINGSLSGVDVNGEDKLFHTSDYMIKGKWADLKHKANSIILGDGLAEKLGVKVNDNIALTTADGVNKNFKIVGIIAFTIASVDTRKGFIPINSARQLESVNESFVTDIQVNIDDYTKARDMAQKLSGVIPYTVEPWQSASGQLEAASGLRDIIAISVSIAILIVAGFGIYNIMNMTVNEKMKEIAILKATGFAGRDIVEIFLLQSVIIGVLGGFTGLLTGFLITVAINHVPFQIATLETLPVVNRLSDYILSFLLGFLATFAAGYLPAKRASKIDPIEIIRSN